MITQERVAKTFKMICQIVKKISNKSTEEKQQFVICDKCALKNKSV